MKAAPLWMWIALCLLRLHVGAQGPAEGLSFDSASVKPARADSPSEGGGFMIALGKQTLPNGVVRATAPLAVFLMFAYDVQDETEARAMRARLPEWGQNQKYAILARVPLDSPTQEQLRQMMRNLLEERFALKVHREKHTGAVQSLFLAKSGATGEGLKSHDPAQVCVRRGSGLPATADPAKPAPVFCGLDLNQSGSMVHLRMIDVTIPEACTLLGGLAGVLGGRGMEPVVDGTSLQGRWDITLDFLSQRDSGAGEGASKADVAGPTFTSALEKQLGLRMKKDVGPVEDLIVDHIQQPTPD